MASTKKVLNKHLKRKADEAKGSLRPESEKELSTNPAYRSKREDSFQEKKRRKENKHKKRYV